MNGSEGRPRLVKRALFEDNVRCELGCGALKMTAVKSGEPLN